MDLAKFFDGVRDRLFGGKLKQSQVDGCGTLIAAFEKARWPVEYAAYGLATAAHETAFTMQPIKERGSDTYLSKYDTGKLAKALGNTPERDGDGILYAGRGYVQLTGLANYRKAAKALNKPLVENPDLAMRPDIAADIMVRGMQEGWFTGKANKTYLDKSPPDYVNARRIINGTDKAALVAGYAKTFELALVAAGYGAKSNPDQEEKTASDQSVGTCAKTAQVAPIKKTDPPPAVIVSDVPLPKGGLWSALARLVASIFKGKSR
jgi:putative chitinase